MRLIVYVFGLFVLTFGTTLSINTRLGLSAGNSFPYVFSQVLNISFGAGLIIVYLFYVFLQWVMLRREFGIRHLLQIPVSLMYGRFANFWVWVIGDFVPESYGGRLIMLFISIFFVALGVVIYVAPNILVNPVEGLTVALAYCLNWPFHRGKSFTDCASVFIAITLCLVFLGELTGIREGTVLSALLTGTGVKYISRVIQPGLFRLCGMKK